MLLSETELRAALEPLLDRMLVERLRLFQLQFEPRLQALIGEALQPEGSQALEEALLRLECGQTPAACFAAVFALSAAIVGRKRVLLVVRQGQAAVWQSEGMELPAHFALARRSQILTGEAAAITVRGRVVGELCWPGGALPAALAKRLELVLRWAGRVLLEQALPEPQAEKNPAKTLAASPTAGVTIPAPASGGTRAERFAALLMEDLRLYLERERPDEFAQGRRSGDWRKRFEPELKRCRQAFATRYPEDMDTAIFEGAVQRLGG